jgi:hypothetical protein
METGWEFPDVQPTAASDSDSDLLPANGAVADTVDAVRFARLHEPAIHTDADVHDVVPGGRERRIRAAASVSGSGHRPFAGVFTARL